MDLSRRHQAANVGHAGPEADSIPHRSSSFEPDSRHDPRQRQRFQNQRVLLQLGIEQENGRRGEWRLQTRHHLGLYWLVSYDITKRECDEIVLDVWMIWPWKNAPVRNQFVYYSHS